MLLLSSTSTLCEYVMHFLIQRLPAASHGPSIKNAMSPDPSEKPEGWREAVNLVTFPRSLGKGWWPGVRGRVAPVVSGLGCQARTILLSQ